MTEREPMCLMCEEEDLYFLYLERRERAEKAARGETAPPDPNWLWPSFARAQSAGPAPETFGRNETLETPLPPRTPDLIRGERRGGRGGQFLSTEGPSTRSPSATTLPAARKRSRGEGRQRRGSHLTSA